MAIRHQIAVSIFDVNLRGRIAPLFFLAILATVLTIMPTAHAQTFQVIHSFTGGLDGANPEAGLTAAGGGHFYGTAQYGGNSNEYCLGTCGAVYKVTHVGSGWVTTPIYDFHGGDPYNGEFDGANPIARVVFGPDGTLYGTASAIFNLRPPATVCKSVLCPWTDTIINFTHQCCYTLGSVLTFDAVGNIYSTSSIGGTYVHDCGGVGCGFVFELMPSNGGWTETDLYSFSGYGDGAFPESGVILDHAGNLYGTTEGFGSGNGTVFELTPSGSGWAGRTLYYFQGGSDGKYPAAGLVFDQEGNLDGAALDGGSGGGGTVFELTSANGNWNFTLLYGLAGNGIWDDGPNQALTMDAAGNIYGATVHDGAYNMGSIFKLTPANGGWTYTSLHDFTGGSDGAYPEGNLALDNEGNLYGTAFSGGNTGANCQGVNYTCGVAFEITP